MPDPTDVEDNPVLRVHVRIDVEHPSGGIGWDWAPNQIRTSAAEEVGMINDAAGVGAGDELTTEIRSERHRDGSKGTQRPAPPPPDHRS